MLWMLYFDGLQECYGLSADDFLAVLFQNSNVFYLYVTTQFNIHPTCDLYKLFISSEVLIDPTSGDMQCRHSINHSCQDIC
jgi:hypothetical protein